MDVTRKKLPAPDPYMAELDLLPAKLLVEHVPKLSFVPFTGAHLDNATDAVVLVAERFRSDIPGKRFVWDIRVEVDLDANVTMLATLRAAGNMGTQRGERVAGKSVRADVDPTVASEVIARMLSRAELGELTLNAEVTAALRDVIAPEPPAAKHEWRGGIPASLWPAGARHAH